MVARDPTAGAGYAIGLAAALVVPLVWAGWLVTSRFGVTHALTPWDVAALRVGVATLIVAPLALRRGLGGLGLARALVLTAGAGAPFALLSFGGMTLAPVAHAGVLSNAAMPLYAALIGYLWTGARITTAQAIGMALIVVGAAAIGGLALAGNAPPGQWLGHLMFIGAGALFALYMTALRAWEVSIAQALVAVPVTSAIVLVPAWLVFLPSGVIGAPDPLPWDEIALQAGFQGVISSIIVVILITRATRSVGPTTIAVFLSSVPVLATAMAFVLLGETPTPLGAIGVAVATVGTVFAVGWRRN